MTSIIMRQYLTSLRRQNTVKVLFGVLMSMTAVAGILGWSSHHTIVGVYDEATRILASQGRPAPPSPFDRTPPLQMLSNMAIYVPLIGALVAIVIGHLAVADDQSTGIARLIFSRPVPRRTYVAGKLFGIAALMALALGAGSAVSAVSVGIVNRSLALSDLGRILGFYAMSWVYLMVFALLGMVTGLASRRRSVALLTAIGGWLIITFVLPQFTSGLRPTASLNPVNDPVGTSQRFFQFTSKLRPVSLSEQFKEASTHILGTAASDATASGVVRFVPLAVSFVVLIGLSFRLVDRHDYSSSSSNE